MATTKAVPEQLNFEGKKVFDAVIKSLVDDGCAKIGGDEHGLMPLTVERISGEADQFVLTPWGNGQIFSFCHYYEQNGDLMQDPEVTFLVVDNREHALPIAKDFKDKEKFTYDFFGVWPMSFTQANMSIYQEAMELHGKGEVKFLAAMQKDITVFCNEWMQNLFHQNRDIQLKTLGMV